MNNNVTILAVSDAAYLKHLVPLAASLNVHFPEARLHAHLINTPSWVAKIVWKFHRNMDCTFERRKFKTESQRKAYCANIRVAVLNNLLKSGVGVLIYMDADSIVRKGLSEFVQLIRDHDIIIRQRFNTGERTRFATGIIGINNSSRTHNFLVRWSEKVDQQKYQWFGDQISFAKTYDELSGPFRLYRLPMQFIDWELLSGSSIWSGKAEKKKERLYSSAEKECLRRAIKDNLSLTFWLLILRLYYYYNSVTDIQPRRVKSVFKRIFLSNV
jgi:hypothetical protein